MSGEYKRPTSELPDERTLCYPSELEGSFLTAEDHKFKCMKPSSELPKTHVEENDNKT